MLHGIDVKLYTQEIIGTDDFNNPIVDEAPVVVHNVLVGQPTETEVLEIVNITGRKAVYVLGIPKGDTNDWVDKTVEFFGNKWHTIGEPIQGIEDLIPLAWNKKVRVEAYNG